MPSFDIVKSSNVVNSFRVSFVRDKFSISADKVTEKFEGNIELPEKWNVGVIVGASGTGKSTIMKELFGGETKNHFGNNPIIDEIAKDRNCDDVCEVFNKVGFSSPPSWLKPYNVLSNGEKMRVDLAAAILSNNKPIVFDEFTSVVDRNVAKIGSYATQKYIRKENKQFVAVSCHYDILEWLEPDWVFCTDDMTFTLGAGLPDTKDPQLKYKYIKRNQTNGNCLLSITI